MRLIGIIGQTGAGKSTVCRALSERGYPVLDGDAVARSITEKNSPVLAELVAAFGDDILDGAALKRKKLAERAFSSPAQTKRLNAITHPAIVALIRKELENIDAPTVFLEGAALLETSLAGECCALVAVTAPEEIRLERILRRDGIGEKEARLRMSAQRGDEEYRKSADFVIINDGKLEIAPQIDRMIKQFELI